MIRVPQPDAAGGSRSARRKPASDAASMARAEADATGGEQRHARVALAAYYLAEKRGFAPGHELDDWLAAEKEIDGIESTNVRRAAEQSAAAHLEPALGTQSRARKSARQSARRSTSARSSKAAAGSARKQAGQQPEQTSLGGTEG